LTDRYSAKGDGVGGRHEGSRTCSVHQSATAAGPGKREAAAQDDEQNGVPTVEATDFRTILRTALLWSHAAVAERSLSPQILNAYHAVAIDERRQEFPATLWNSPPAPGQTMKQVYFCGVHCDVGGGYRRSRP
jgi:hypothetical protein